MDDLSKVSDLPADLLWKVCKKSFAAYCYLIQEPGWMDSVHVQLCNFIQYHLEALYPPGTKVNDPSKTATLKLAVIMPRGSLKSTIMNRNFTTWLNIYFSEDENGDPLGEPSTTELRSFIVTNTHAMGKKKMSNILAIYESHSLYRSAFPRLSKDSKATWNSERAILPRRIQYEDATFESGGVGTKKTGSHYNFILEDDTLAPDADEMTEGLTLPSPETMGKAIGYHQAAHPLLVPKGVRIRLIVTTRWGEGDLIDYIRAGDKGWKIFDMPAFNAADECNFSNFYSKEQLEEIRIDIGEFMFACLYMNCPNDPRAKVFSPLQITRARTSDVPDLDSFSYLTLAVDPAISLSESACNTAITLCGHRNNSHGRSELFLLDAIARRMEMAETIHASIAMAKTWGIHRCRAFIIEAIAYQAALLSEFSEELSTQGYTCSVIPFASRTNKVERIRASLEPLFSSDRFRFLNTVIPQFEKELEHFPHGKLVDVIDSVSMHRIQMKQGPGKPILTQEPELSDWDRTMADILSSHASSSSTVFRKNSIQRTSRYGSHFR